MKNKKKILLFEDTKESLKKVRKAIEDNLSKENIECIVFAENEFKTKTNLKATYEKRILKELEDEYYKDVILIVCDRALSLTEGYQGLSEVIVSSVASQLGIPVCLYARGLDTKNILARQREWGNGRIVLRNYPKSRVEAREVVVLAKGFMELKKKIEVLLKNKKIKTSPPSDILAKLLGHPEYNVQIALYDINEPKLFSDINSLRNKSGKQDLEKLNRKFSCLLGYWLYNSIIRFPGLLLNEVAAASYFNISQSEFNKKNVRKLFDFALYRGPFSNLEYPLWWRGLIDNHLLNSGYKKELEFAEKQLKRKVQQCQCSVDSKKNAGYYCIVTNKPVSFENSFGNIKFFPRGANLTRVSKNKYEEDGPWVNI